MISKEELWASIANEYRILKHLATKIPEGQHHHKPTEKQRTTLELLQFLAHFGSGCFQSYLDGSMAAFAAGKEKAASVTVENFGAAIDAELAVMQKLYGKFTDEQPQKDITMFGRTQKRSLFLLDFAKMITGYKMQLFLYAKQSGNHAISTANVWGGIDMPAPAAKA